MSDKTKKQSRGISPLAVWVVTNCVWYCLFFSRELIFSLLAALLYVFMFWNSRKTIWGWWSLILLILMSIATLLYRK
jgi:hypothetical protein